MKVVLASGSPRRRELLATLGIPFEVAPSCVDERDPFPGEEAPSYALELAREKARDVACRRPHQTVLAADTVVEVDGRILNKPLDRADARSMLQILRGRQHRVTTAVVVRCDGMEHAGHVTAGVAMRSYDDREIDEYVASGEPMDKAGAYAVQGLGGSLVSSVLGCRNAVIGLPLDLSAALLGECGVPVSSWVNVDR